MRKDHSPNILLAIRWMHWINFPVLFVMIWSGMLIYWANDVYKIHLGHDILFSFFPELLLQDAQPVPPPGRGHGLSFCVHVGILPATGWSTCYIRYFPGNGAISLPDRHSFKRSVAHRRPCTACTSARRRPRRPKYNGAQKIAYTAIIVMGLGSVLTGLAIYKPAQFFLADRHFSAGAAMPASFISSLTLGYCLFFLIHVVQVILASWNNFRAMVAGFDVIDQPPAMAIMGPPLPVPAPSCIHDPHSRRSRAGRYHAHTRGPRTRRAHNTRFDTRRPANSPTQTAAIDNLPHRRNSTGTTRPCNRGPLLLDEPSPRPATSAATRTSCPTRNPPVPPATHSLGGNPPQSHRPQRSTLRRPADQPRDP